MTRTRKFHKIALFRSEMVQDAEAGDAAARMFLDHFLARLTDPEPWDVRGPRGGRYVADGPLRGPDRSADYAFATDQTAYRVTRIGRYVRPRQSSSPPSVGRPHRQQKSSSAASSGTAQRQ